MSISISRKLCGTLAESFLLKPLKNAHDHHAGKINLPLFPKIGASVYCIMKDYGDGLFPPRFSKDSLYESESNYIRDQLEIVESSIRSPFCVLEGRPYMNRQKLLDMLKFFQIIDQLALPRGAKLLEVGGGAGWLAELLCIKGYNVWTSTLAQGDTATARLRCDSLKTKGLDTMMTALSAPMEEIHAHVNSEMPFDVAFCHGALHHAYSWKDTIRSLKQCLRPQGYLLITDEPAWYHTLLCYRSAKIQGRHEIGFFKKSLISFLRSESFQVLKVQRRLSLSLPLWIVAKLRE